MDRGLGYKLEIYGSKFSGWILERLVGTVHARGSCFNAEGEITLGDVHIYATRNI